MLIVSGTNRPDANTYKVAKIYQEKLKEKGQASTILDLKDLPADFTATALYGSKNEVYSQLAQKIEAAQKIIFIMPEYNGSFPGVLKAFIDGLKFPDALAGKKTALVGVASGVEGAAIPLSHFTDVLTHVTAHVYGRKIKLGQIHKFMAEDGKSLNNETYNTFIDRQIDGFISF